MEGDGEKNTNWVGEFALLSYGVSETIDNMFMVYKYFTLNCDFSSIKNRTIFIGNGFAYKITIYYKKSNRYEILHIIYDFREIIIN